jgi:hypothetical protein
MRIIDLSVCLEAGIAADPPGMRPDIAYRDHAGGGQEFVAMFPGLRPEGLPEGQGAAIERLQLTTHNGAHHPWEPLHSNLLTHHFRGRSPIYLGSNVCRYLAQPHKYGIQVKGRWPLKTFSKCGDADRRAHRADEGSGIFQAVTESQSRSTARLRQ